MFRRISELIWPVMERESTYVFPDHSIICDCRMCVREATRYINRISRRTKR